MEINPTCGNQVPKSSSTEPHDQVEVITPQHETEKQRRDGSQSEEPTEQRTTEEPFQVITPEHEAEKQRDGSQSEEPTEQRTTEEQFQVIIPNTATRTFKTLSDYLNPLFLHVISYYSIGFCVELSSHA